ncbi:transposase [Cryobacterium flavum]|uniref:Transposase n=1 Tax=Cryobacterium flavum TaxID=1424659 RepID=A0ABY2I6T7_9MICO|nr:transposase [Cryobacterium flavum]
MPSRATIPGYALAPAPPRTAAALIPAAPAGADEAASGTDRAGAQRRSEGPAVEPVRGQSAGGDPSDPPRRGHLPVLGGDDVSPPPRSRRDRGTSRSAEHPARVKPELIATGPNTTWSWDISKLKGPAKWSYFHLYAIIDIYSRYVVGWMVATRESHQLAARLLFDTIEKQNIRRDQLTIHSDNGSSMASKPVAFLLADLGVTKSHSRPHTSNDNPFSESHFKILKYWPEFPDRFYSLAEARSFCTEFYDWYNGEHRHSGIDHLCRELRHGDDPVRLMRFGIRLTTKHAGATLHDERSADVRPRRVGGHIYVALSKRKRLADARRRAEHHLDQVPHLPVGLGSHPALCCAPVAGREADCGYLIRRKRLRGVLGLLHPRGFLHRIACDDSPPHGKPQHHAEDRAGVLGPRVRDRALHLQEKLNAADGHFPNREVLEKGKHKPAKLVLVDGFCTVRAVDVEHQVLQPGLGQHSERRACVR